MTIPDLLALLRLLSALESWALSQQAPLPDYLHEGLTDMLNKIQEEILR